MASPIATSSPIGTKQKRLIISLLLLCVAAFSAVAQTFRTQAPATVGQDEQIRVQYVLSTNGGEDFRCPPSADFDILGGPSTSTYSSMQWVNGKSSSSSSITYTYILQARRTGKLALPRPSVRVGGKTLHATPLSINVVAGSGRPKGQGRAQQQAPRSAGDEDMHDDIRTARAVTPRDLYVRCTATKSTLYEQEPVVLTYKVYARTGVGLSQVVPRRKPEMKGFWTQEVELPSNLQPTYENIGGSTYRVFTFMQFVAFPQQTGTLTLPPLITDCSVVQRDPHIDPLEAFFNGGGSLTTRLQRSTEAVALTVKPLPTPRPAGFSGGVGRLQAEGKLLSEPATNDIATYRITVSGQGNMKLIQPPHVSFPKSFDSYDPKTSDATRITYGGIAGKITFDYTFVPREEGDFLLPATDFTYFDIEAGSYRTVHLPATPLHVKKGQRSREDVEHELALRQSDIRPDRTAPASARQLGYGAYLLALLGIILLALLADRLMRLPLADRLHRFLTKGRVQRNRRLSAAEAALAQGDAQTFYAALDQAFQASDADPEAASRLLSRRFAPDAAEPSVMQSTMEAARKLLPLLLLALLPATGLAAPAADSAAVAPALAVSPADSLYNAGNAAYRLKENAQAVLCYSRALWLDPDHDDARYNLALVQTRLEDRFSPPQEMFFTTLTRTLRTSHSTGTWLAWSLLLAALLALCVLTFRRVAQPVVRRVVFYLGLVALILFVTTNIFAFRQHCDQARNAQAVVMADAAPLYNSPVARSKPALTLHAGTTVLMADAYGKDWVEVVLPDTRRFWASRKHLCPVRQ